MQLYGFFVSGSEYERLNYILKYLINIILIKFKLILFINVIFIYLIRI